MHRPLENTSPAPPSAAGDCPPTLVVLLKAPRVGTVKTRLAAALGAEQATRVYRRLVERQMAAVPSDWPLEVHFAPAEAEPEMRAWLGPRPRLCPQVDGDLGARLRAAVDSAFVRGAASVLVIGGDCPELDEAALRAAAKVLRSHAVVIGPARDGGYYLIGLTRSLPGLFSGIPWSTEHVFEETLQRCAELRLVPRTLPPRDDIDTLADLRRHAAVILGVDGLAGGGAALVRGVKTLDGPPAAREDARV
jgi:rSAM/selenodomain-associated transferase 1